MISARTAPIDDTPEGDRWFESGSLQQRVCLSPGAVVEGREPRLSARLCAAGLPTGSAETRRVFQMLPTGGNISVAPYSSTAVPLIGVGEKNADPNKGGAFAEA